MLPVVVRNANGHDMEIRPNYDMGGGLEEFMFWCHTCDPTGSNCQVEDVRNQGALNAFVNLINFSQGHELQ